MEEYTLEPAHFSDYRSFLKHRFQSLQAKSKSYSLQMLARKSSLSKSHLQFLFNRKRHISLDKLPSLAKALKFSPDEEAFVYLLICKNSSRNPSVQKHFEFILSRIRHEHLVVTRPEPKRSDNSIEFLYQDHVAMLIHSMVRLTTFREDPEWILENLPIPDLTIERITETLKLLEEKNAILRKADGSLEAGEFPYWRPNPYDLGKLSTYQRGAEAVAHLLKTPEVYKPSVYMLMSHAYDEPSLLKAEKLMIELHHNLAALAEQSKEPTANMFAGNFFMTLARTKA